VNAQVELLSFLAKEDKTLYAASIEIPFAQQNRSIELFEGHGPIALNAFLQSLDFEYENGLEGEPDRYFSMTNFTNVIGTLWFTDGAWARRKAIDDEEWWEIQPTIDPPVPDRLRCG
jgi:hypothetical protein